MSKSGKLLLNTLFVAAAAGTGFYFARQPWQVYREQQLKTDKAKKEMRDAEEERAKAAKDGARLESPLGQEGVANSRGFHKSNEKPVDLNL